MTRLGAMVRGFNQGFGRGVSGFAGGAQAEQAGFDAAMGRETKLAQALAQIRASDANAERDGALAAEARRKTDALAQRPDLFEEQAALAAGVDLPTLRAVRRSVATGQAPQVELPGPATPEGGTLMGTLDVAPEVRSRIGQALMRFVPLQANTGDIAPDNWAQALGRFADQDLQDQAVRGDMPQGQLSRALSVLKASPIYKIPEGFTGDQFSGDIPMASPVNTGRQALVAAQTGAQQANARQSDAQAEAAGALRDQRMREPATSENGAPPKPLSSGALKMQQDYLDKIGIASSINADLVGLRNQIEEGKLAFGPISNLANTGRNLAGISTEQSRNFGTFKSTLERLRNESLRLNTGVQTDGDAQRAWNELFQNINDTKLVRQRLEEIEKINERGAELQRLRLENLRAEFGQPPLDVSAYVRQPAAVGAPPAPPPQVPASGQGGFKYLGREPGAN